MNMDDMSGMSPSSTSMDMAMPTSSMAMMTPTSSPHSMSQQNPMPASMSGMKMPSSASQSFQAGMATSMPEMKNMCSLSGMEEMCTSHRNVVVGVCAALMVLATAAVVLRLFSRKLSAVPFWWDDIAIVASLFVSYVCSAITFVDADNGIGKHFETVSMGSVALVYKVYRRLRSFRSEAPD